jgi:hypothetical protein
VWSARARPPERGPRRRSRRWRSSPGARPLVGRSRSPGRSHTGARGLHGAWARSWHAASRARTPGLAVATSMARPPVLAASMARPPGSRPPWREREMQQHGSLRDARMTSGGREEPANVLAGEARGRGSGGASAPPWGTRGKPCGLQDLPHQEERARRQEKGKGEQGLKLCFQKTIRGATYVSNSPHLSSLQKKNRVSYPAVAAAANFTLPSASSKKCERWRRRPRC